MKKFSFVLIGISLTSIGALILKQAGIMTGGTAGLSLILTYIADLPFALVFSLVNIPFYILAIMFMGWSFTASTIMSVTLLSLLIGLENWLPSFAFPVLISAIAGGVLIGIGLSILFMNRTSLGGANILALILQKKFGWNPGKIIFLFDVLVVSYGFYTIGISKGLLSVLSILITSHIISSFKNKISATNRTVQKKNVSYPSGKTLVTNQ